MAFGPFGSAESGTFGGAPKRGGGGYTLIGDGDSIVASPALAGSFSYKIDPVNAHVTFEDYGATAMLGKPNLLSVSFRYQITADVDESISICELGDGSLGGTIARQLTQDNLEKLGLVDADEDAIVTSSPGYITAGTIYPMLWLVDLRTPTRDMLWAWKSGAWDLVWDVSDWGVGDPDDIDRITCGTAKGKGLPTVGGPFYVDEMVPQILNVAPNTDPIGSITTRFKVPTANGTDGDFDTGSPDWNDVKEIPHDGDTSYDEGDAADQKQSYAIANATGGDTPLAIQVIGAAKETAVNAVVKSYIYDGSTRDYEDNNRGLFNVYDNLSPNFNDGGITTYNRINGAPITESLFNTLEAGVEVISLSEDVEARLTQIGLEYIVEGPYALPDDFPAILPHLHAGAALGSANVGIY